MILRALYDLAEREHLVTDSDFTMTPVAWRVRVSDDGRIISIEDNRVEEAAVGNKKPRLQPRSIRIPRQLGRSGKKAPPAFFVDNAKYVFGIATEDKPFSEDEGREKSGWFRDMVAACATATSDPGALAVLAALDDVRAGRQTVTLPEECVSNHQFAFVLASDVDTCVHDRPAIVAYWREQRTENEASGSPVSAPFQCIVTGEPVMTPGLFPKVKRVPGGMSSGVSLVSFNASAFESFGWDSNENAALSRTAAEACATALDRLVHPAYPTTDGDTLPQRHIRIGDSTVVAYWASKSSADPMLERITAVLTSSGDPALVGELLSSWRAGWPTTIDDASRFYALTLSAAQARVVVRDWFETSVADVARNVAMYVDDISIVRNTPPPRDKAFPPIPRLDVLLASLAPFGKRENIPPALAGSFVSAALRGAQFPFSVLQRALERTRAEIGKDEWSDLDRRDARAALIKGVLNRRRRMAPAQASYPELTNDMDPANQNAGYLLGRLMAVLERLQQAALDNPNASVVDRYFGAASATPRGVFVRLLKNARHHARKARDDDKTAGIARWLERQVDDIVDRFDPKNNGFPAFLSVEDQGLFVLGYHQQRHWLNLPKEQREQNTASTSAVVTAA